MGMMYLDSRDLSPRSVVNLQKVLTRELLPQGDIHFSEIREWGFRDYPQGPSRRLYGFRMLAEDRDEVRKSLEKHLDPDHIEVLRLISDVKEGIYRASVSAKGRVIAPHMDSLAKILQANNGLKVETEHADVETKKWFGSRNVYNESALVVKGDPRMIAAVQGLMRQIITDFSKRLRVDASQEVVFL